MKTRYYPQAGGNPIHPVRSWAYVRRLVRAARRGDRIPPYLVDGTPDNGNALTGTHRAAANDLLELLGDSARIPWVSVGDLSLEDQERAEGYIGLGGEGFCLLNAWWDGDGGASLDYLEFVY